MKNATKFVAGVLAAGVLAVGGLILDIDSSPDILDIDRDGTAVLAILDID